ncbi:MAG TPA: hypothetical protein VK098_03855 [Beutenbergiaceae bacterium]|nr:hypothetical protein [Beutenbergiaceae bacterium]
MSNERPVEPPLTPRAEEQPELDSKTARGVAWICRSRAQMWEVLAEVLGEPTDERVDLLRSGELEHRLQEAIEWLGDDAGRFLDTEMMLGLIGRRSKRLEVEADRADRRAKFAELFGPGAPFEDGHTLLLTRAAELAASCREEAAAWAGENGEEAKALRMAQAKVIEDDLANVIPPWAHDLDEAATHPFGRMCARFTVSVLSIESGRDFESTVFRGAAPLTFSE